MWQNIDNYKHLNFMWIEILVPSNKFCTNSDFVSNMLAACKLIHFHFLSSTEVLLYNLKKTIRDEQTNCMYFDFFSKSIIVLILHLITYICVYDCRQNWPCSVVFMRLMTKEDKQTTMCQQHLKDIQSRTNYNLCVTSLSTLAAHTMIDHDLNIILNQLYFQHFHD